MDNPFVIAAVCAGATALVKKLGVQGDWLVLVCVLAGALYAFLLNYQPAAIRGLSGIIAALAATGNVALAKDMLSSGRLPARAVGAE